MQNIVTILPKDEGFSRERFGAIALCMRDFTLASRYRDQTIVISGVAGDSFAGIHFRPAPRPRWYENRTAAYARHCIAVIREQNAALAEVHNRPQLLRLIAPKITCKLALHLHNDPQEMRDAKTPAERAALLKLCSGIYCVSEFIRQRFMEGLTRDLHKLYVVHNGIPLATRLPEKKKRIAFAGRMTEGKGALLLAQALASALPQLPDWNARLVGSDRHSAAEKLSPREQAIAAALAPVADQVKLEGFCVHEKTLAKFAVAAIAVVPSVWDEPFGRTAIEAMSYGCALISSGRGALREVTGDAALTLTELTAESLAAAIVRLANDDAAREALQRAARERVQQFAIAKCTDTLDKARESILKETADAA